MANKPDDDYANDLDDTFETDEITDTDVVDDLDDGITDDTSDYTDDNDGDDEEGIFAPASEEKKSKLPLLLGIAGAVIVGAGGVWYFSQSGSSTDVPPEIAAQMQDPDAISTVSDSVPENADVAAVPAAETITDSTTTQQTPVIASGEPGAQPSVDQVPVATTETPPLPVQATQPADEPAVPPAGVPAETALSSEPEATSLTSATQAVPPSETTTAPSETSVAPSLAEPAPVTDTANSNVVPTEPIPQPVEEAPPSQTALAPTTLPSPQQATLSGTVEGSDTTPYVPTPSARREETVYFDSPEINEILSSKNTPTMDPKRGPGESIIIVHNASNPAPATSSRADNPANATQESRILAANRALKLGRYEAAMEMYNDLYRVNPRDARILMGRAVTLQKLGRMTEAVTAYEAVLAIDSENPEAIVNMMGLVRKEYPAVALEKLLDLRTKYPKNAGIAAQLGVTYADAGNLDDAARYLNTAIQLDPQNPQHYFNLGVIAERMKDRQKAIAYYEKALEIDAVYGSGRGISRDQIYDRLTRLRG